MASAQVAAQVETQFPVGVGCQPPAMSTYHLALIQTWWDCTATVHGPYWQCCITLIFMKVGTVARKSHSSLSNTTWHTTVHRLLYRNAQTGLCTRYAVQCHTVALRNCFEAVYSDTSWRHSCSTCASVFTYHTPWNYEPGTHHCGGNADVQMMHASRWVVVIQVVVHMLMGAIPATPQQHMTHCYIVHSLTLIQIKNVAQFSVRKFIVSKCLSCVLKLKKFCCPQMVTYNMTEGKTWQ